MNYHNTRQTKLTPRQVERLAGLLQLHGNTDEKALRNVIASILKAYAAFRFGTHQKLNTHISEHLEAPLDDQGLMKVVSDNVSFNNCGYLIDYLFQNHLQLQTLSLAKRHNTRKTLGAFYTPYEVARFIVNHTVDDYTKDQNILDPACGTGVFLSAVAHHLINLGCSPSHFLKQLHGWDKSSLALSIAHLLVSLEVADNAEQVLTQKKINFVVKDSLLNDNRSDLFSTKTEVISNTKFDYILTNPPYDRLKPDGLDEIAKKEILAYCKSIKSSGMYEFSTVGSLELYRLFVERIFCLIKDSSGKAGFIIPRTFTADKSAQDLRTYGLKANIFEKVFHIPEREKLFEGVSQAFCILILNTKKKSKQIHIETLNKKLSSDSNRVTISIDQIKRSFRNTAALLDLSNEGHSLLNHLNKFTPIKEVDWVSNFRGEVDLTIFKDLLNKGSDRLLRGRGVSEYQASNYENIELMTLIERLGESNKITHLQRYRICCQQIANMDSPKRLKFSLVEPNIALGNSLNYIVINENNLTLLYGLLAIMNSILMDWRFRITSTNNHVNNYEIDEFPLPIDKIAIHRLGEKLKANIKLITLPQTRASIELDVLKLYSAEECTLFLTKEHPMGYLLQTTTHTDSIAA